MDEETVGEYKAVFPEWVESQQIQTGAIYVCDADVRVDRPFIDDDRMWSIWASQNCKGYDLMLTLILSQEADFNMVGYIGVDEDDVTCRDTTFFDNTVSCEFRIDFEDKFGVLFTGGFMPVFYTTEFVKTKEPETAYSWWFN